MSSNIIYPQGKAEITIPATESIAVFTVDDATVKRELGYPNVPATESVLGVVSNGQTVFGSYASGATIIIEAGAAPVYYVVGVAPLTQEFLAAYQDDPVAVNTTGAVSAAAIMGGIVTSTTAAGVAGTLPTGTVLEAASEFAIDEYFDWSVQSTGASTFTVTAASDHTLVGNMTVTTGLTGHFRTRKTAAGVFVTYRLG